MLYAAGAAAWAGRPLRSLAFLLDYTLVYVPIGVGWWMWDRTHPQVVLEGIASPGGIFPAYPSGHVVQAAFAYGLRTALWIEHRGALRRTGACLLIVALVTPGRLRIGTCGVRPAGVGSRRAPLREEWPAPCTGQPYSVCGCATAGGAAGAPRGLCRHSDGEVQPQTWWIPNGRDGEQ